MFRMTVLRIRTSEVRGRATKDRIHKALETGAKCDKSPPLLLQAFVCEIQGGKTNALTTKAKPFLGWEIRANCDMN